MTAAVYEAPPVRWWVPLVEGILAILIGIWFFTQPVATSVGFVLAIGIYWFVVGVIDLVRLFWDRTRWGWKLFSGIVGILAGGMIVSGILGQNHPLGTAFVVGSTFTIVVGLMGIIYGIIALVDAFRGGGWWSGVLGGFGILFGLVLLANPLGATLALPWTLGILLIAGGIFLIVLAFRLR